MKVNLTYFKLSGKYYTSDSYEAEKEHLWEIWQEVAEDPKLNKSFCHILVDVPDHPHNHPHLLPRASP